jgi:hypothetical protein
MLRVNNRSIWWANYPRTPNPDTTRHRETRTAFYSFDKFEEHRESHHAAISHGGYDSDQEQGRHEFTDGASDWQGQDGNACTYCEDFKEVWMMEE